MDGGGISIGLGVTIDNRPRQFLPKVKIASERLSARADRERGPPPPCPG